MVVVDLKSEKQLHTLFLRDSTNFGGSLPHFILSRETGAQSNGGHGKRPSKRLVAGFPSRNLGKKQVRAAAYTTMALLLAPIDDGASFEGQATSAMLPTVLQCSEGL